LGEQKASSERAGCRCNLEVTGLSQRKVTEFYIGKLVTMTPERFGVKGMGTGKSKDKALRFLCVELKWVTR